MRDLVKKQLAEINIIDNGITDYDKAIQDAKNSKLIGDFAQKADNFNSTDKLSDFMSKKYNIRKELLTITAKSSLINKIIYMRITLL